jgi:uncharacterized PurR-regulated membrane protein YhhQ (DUF165 family)
MTATAPSTRAVELKLFVPLAVGYVALVVLANWLASKYIITVPFTHYLAPAGVLCIGAVLVLRDWVQQLRGLKWALSLILVAGLASFAVAFIVGYSTPPGHTLLRVSAASLAAFALSEGVLETLIFTPLRKRSFTGAVALSATAGNALDSFVFIWLAFGWSALSIFYMGNFIGKLEMIVVGVALTALRRYFLPTEAVAT